MHNQRKIEKFIELRAAGLSFENISKKINVTKPTLIQWSKKYYSKLNEQQKIANDSLYRQFFVAAQGRILLLGKQLQSLSNELDCRDLSSVPTDRLLDLKLKYAAALKQEETFANNLEPEPTKLVEYSLWEFRDSDK